MPGLFLGQVMAEGPIGSGGGNVCTIGDRRVLLDFVGLESSLFDHDKTGEPLAFETKYQSLGFMPAPIYSGNIKQRILEILDRHKNQHLINLLKTAMDSLIIFGVPRRFGKPLGADFSRASQCNQKNTQAVIGYVSSMIFISIPAWNELSLMTQIGLLIHEGVRTLQKIYPVKLEDGALQDITAALFSDNLKSFSTAAETVYEKASPNLVILKNQFRQFVSGLSQRGHLPVSLTTALKSHLDNPPDIQEALLLRLAGSLNSPLASDEFEKISDLHYAIRLSYPLENSRLSTISFFLSFTAGLRIAIYEALENPANGSQDFPDGQSSEHARENKKITEIRALIDSFD
jgi:hypothetical protein